jgi:hypothetical protein
MNHLYSLLKIGSVTNCSECDKFTQTNSYERDDDLVVDLCAGCQSRLHA